MKIAPEGSWVQNEHVASVIGSVIVNCIAVLLLFSVVFRLLVQTFLLEDFVFSYSGQTDAKI